MPIPTWTSFARRDVVGLIILTLALAIAAAAPLEASAQIVYRSIDGTNNNQLNPSWGNAVTPLRRAVSSDYGDGISTPAGAARPSARAVSNALAAQSVSLPNLQGVTDFFWQWGQFLDHDIDLSGTHTVIEPFDIAVPAGDAFYDPLSAGDKVILLDRSLYEMVGDPAVREQVNQITAYLDASNVYGSDDVRATWIRNPYVKGRLRRGKKRMLPTNVERFDNAPNDDAMWFLAGDERANEQVALTSMHTIFLREHNWMAKKTRFVRWVYDEMDGPKPATEKLSATERYQMARMIVMAELQAITYNEFMPVLLGAGALGEYQGYDDSVDASIANIFSTAAYRFGHTMLSRELLRLDRRGREIKQGHLQLLEAFFAPHQLLKGRGIAPLMRGLAANVAQDVDTLIIDDVRNFLFGPPGSGGFDLAALNIQRGRDHGLPSYNQTRSELGLTPAASFADITSDATVEAALASVYASVDDVDLWVAGLAEDDQFPNGLVGETFFTILQDQFRRIRDGDQFWYQIYLSPALVEYVEERSLATIIRRNTKCGKELPESLFVLGG